MTIKGLFNHRVAILNLPIIVSVALFSVCSSTQVGKSKDDCNLTPAGKVAVIETMSGELYLGRVTVLNEESLILTTDKGQTQIAYAEIDEIAEHAASKVRDGEIWKTNPNRTRLFVAPKATMESPGSGYYANHYLFLHQVSIGVTENISASAGFSTLPTELEEQVGNVGIKLGTSLNDIFDVAIGYQLLGNVNSGAKHITYGVLTRASGDHSITLGFGSFIENQQPVWIALMGVELRTSNSTSFVMENYYAAETKLYGGPDTWPLLSAGFRIFGERWTLDLAGYYRLEENEDFNIMPYFDFAVFF